jgi:hypothetical protein
MAPSSEKPRPLRSRIASGRSLSPRNASRLYIALGLCAWLGCAALALYPQIALRGANIADGTVVALRGDDKSGFAPIIQFSEPDGGVVRWSGGSLSKPSPYAMGQHVPMVYVPNGNSAIAIGSFWSLHAPAVACFVFGVLFVGFGLLGLRAVRRMELG